MQRSNAVATIAIVFLGSFVGCGGGDSGPTGTISGKLSLNGKVPPLGCQIQFMSNEGSVSADVFTDGSFTIEEAPVASYKVAVSLDSGPGDDMNPEAAMKMVAGEDGNSSNPDAFSGNSLIPAKYMEFETSGVTFDVKKGNNEFTLDMKE